MKKPHRIVTRAARESTPVIEQFCQANGQILLPIVNLIQNASQVVETVIHEIGRQTLELILVPSAEQVAGPRTLGKASGDIRHHGSQAGCVQLADRKVKVKRPRLRHKTEGEVKIPAYEMLGEGGYGGGIAERHQSQGGRGQHRATPTVAGTPLGGSGSPGDLRGWATIRRPPHHQRCGRGRRRQEAHLGHRAGSDRGR